MTSSGPAPVNEQLELIFEAAPTAMLMVDSNRCIVLANSLIQEIFGYTQGEMHGQAVEMLIPTRYRESHSQQVADFFANPARRKMGVGREVEGCRKCGESFPCELALSPMRIGDQDFVLVALADITERKRAERESRLAHEIQQAMLPKAPPEFPGFDIAGKSVPADATGGDFYDYVPLPGGELAVVIGDVSGHGFGPALLSATAKSFLRSLIMTQEDAGEALSLTNELLIEESLAGQFVTVMALVFDSQTGSLRYVGAGHESYVFDRNGALKLTLASTGFPLGLESGQSYSLSDPVPLEPGDFIVALTDGVVEAASPKGELFGKARLTDSMRTVAQFSAEQIVESLYEIVEDFRRDKPQNDDITAVVVKFRA